MAYSHEGADGGGRRRWVCPPPVPPKRWAGIWSRIGWGLVRAPHPAETAGWWWWWTQNPTATPTLEKERELIHLLYSEGQKPTVVWLFICENYKRIVWLVQRLSQFQPNKYTNSYPSFSYHPVHIWRKLSSRGFQSMCPCDDTWRLKREILASFFIQGHRDDTLTGKEKVRKVHYHLKCQSTCQSSMCFKQLDKLSWQRTNSSVLYEIQCHQSWGRVC